MNKQLSAISLGIPTLIAALTAVAEAQQPMPPRARVFDQDAMEPSPLPPPSPSASSPPPPSANSLPPPPPSADSPPPPPPPPLADSPPFIPPTDKNVEAKVVNGVCVTKLARATADESTYNIYKATCAQLLVPIAGVVNIPGLLFIGGALGTKAKKFAIAPSVAFSAGAAIPLKRPLPGYFFDEGDHYSFKLPAVARLYVNLLLSAVTARSAPS